MYIQATVTYFNNGNKTCIVKCMSDKAVNIRKNVLKNCPDHVKKNLVRMNYIASIKKRSE